MLTVQPVIGEKEILTMNSGSLGKARRRAVRKVAFMLVLMLVTLAYAVTPLTAFACDGNNQDKGNKPPKNPVAASDNQAIADLKGASKIASLTIKGNPVQLNDIKPPDKFQIAFEDGVKLDAVCVVAGIAPNAAAIVQLPSGKKKLFQPKAKGDKIVTDIVASDQIPQSVANGSKESSLFQNSSSSDWLLFTLNNSPLKRSAIKKAGQKFKIERIGSSILLKAVYLGSGNIGQNLVLVTLLNKQLISIPLSAL
jgi:hypothetical protein